MEIFGEDCTVCQQSTAAECEGEDSGSYSCFGVCAYARPDLGSKQRKKGTKPAGA